MAIIHPGGSQTSPHAKLPERWPEPVDGAALMRALCDAVNKYMVVPEGSPEASGAWVLHAFALDAFQISPLLQVTSPTKGCGKSTFLTVLSFLVPKPLMFSNASPASLFRIIHRDQPTILMDEADSAFALGEAMRNLLNASHLRSAAKVMRCDGKSFEPREFSVWAPKVVAGIGRLPSTVEDRAIRVELRRQERHEHRSQVRLDRLSDEFDELRRKAVRWAEDNLAALRQSEPRISEELSARQADNWRPLLGIADLCGEEWPGRCREAALLLSAPGADTEDADPAIMLLADLRSLFQEDGTDRLSSAAVVAGLANMEERLWAEWGNGQPISKYQLAALLRPYGIRPKSIRIGDETPKGYEFHQFLTAWSRYLPASRAAPEHPAQPQLQGERGSVPPDAEVAPIGAQSSPNGKRPASTVARTMPNGVLPGQSADPGGRPTR